MLGLVHRPILLVALCAAVYPRRPRQQTLCFGGDTGWPTSSAAYAIQARRWLNRSLQAEIDDGFLNEPQAMALAQRLMRENQLACFDIEGTQRTGGGLINGSILPTVQQSCSRSPARLLLPLLQRSPRLSTRAGFFPKEHLALRPPTPWRYAEALPEWAGELSLGEVLSPLVPFDVDGHSVLLKCDQAQPLDPIKIAVPPYWCAFFTAAGRARSRRRFFGQCGRLYCSIRSQSGHSPESLLPSLLLRLPSSHK